MHRTERSSAVGRGDLGDSDETEPFVELNAAGARGHEATRNTVRVASFDQRRDRHRTEPPTVAGGADTDVLKRPMRLVHVVGAGGDDRRERVAGSHFSRMFSDDCPRTLKVVDGHQ
jgi:hypothetical protein